MVGSTTTWMMGRWVQAVMHLIRCLLGAAALAGWALCHVLTPFLPAPWPGSLDALLPQAVRVPGGLGQWTATAGASPGRWVRRGGVGWLARGHAGEPTGLHPGPGPPGGMGLWSATATVARSPPGRPAAIGVRLPIAAVPACGRGGVSIAGGASRSTARGSRGRAARCGGYRSG